MRSWVTLAAAASPAQPSPGVIWIIVLESSSLVMLIGLSVLLDLNSIPFWFKTLTLAFPTAPAVDRCLKNVPCENPKTIHDFRHTKDKVMEVTNVTNPNNKTYGQTSLQITYVSN